jgi:hypothetical protein
VSSPLHEKARRQIAHELDAIGRLGLAGYFLAVWDIVRFARSRRSEAGVPDSEPRTHHLATIASAMLNLPRPLVIEGRVQNRDHVVTLKPDRFFGPAGRPARRRLAARLSLTDVDNLHHAVASVTAKIQTQPSTFVVDQEPGLGRARTGSTARLARAEAHLVLDAEAGGHHLAAAHVEAALGRRFDAFHAVAPIESGRLLVEHVAQKR